MLASVDFISLETFKGTAIASDMAVISIGDPASTPPNLAHGVPALRMEFLDLTPDELEQYGMPVDCLIAENEVAQILAFIEGLVRASDRYRLVVHCNKGYSRSAAVALVVHAMTGCEFPRKLDAYDANTYVLQLASKQLQKDVTRPDAPASVTYRPLPARLLI